MIVEETTEPFFNFMLCSLGTIPASDSCKKTQAPPANQSQLLLSLYVICTDAVALTCYIFEEKQISNTTAMESSV